MKVDKRMIADADVLHRLDSMMGLIQFNEIFESVGMPAVAQLQPLNTTDWDRYIVISGSRKKDHYKVRGVYACACLVGFEGRLSLDGRTLTVLAGQRTCSKDVELLHETSSSLTALVREFSGYSGPISPFDYNVEYYLKHLLPLMRCIKAGQGISKEIISVATGNASDAIAIWRTMKGWYRTYRWSQIADEHWAAARALGCAALIDHEPVSLAIAELNREIGKIGSLLNRQSRGTSRS